MYTCTHIPACILTHACTDLHIDAHACTHIHTYAYVPEMVAFQHMGGANEHVLARLQTWERQRQIDGGGSRTVARSMMAVGNCDIAQ